MLTGERLKQLRSERGWSLQTVADKVNKHKSTLSSIESNKARAGGALIEEFAKLYNVTTDYLLGLSEHRTLDEANSLNVTEEVKHYMAKIDTLNTENKEMLLTMMRALFDDNEDKKKSGQ